MVSEQTARRIADSLDKLVELIDRLAREQEASGPPPIPPYVAPHLCFYCGVDHGGLTCPGIARMAASSAKPLPPISPTGRWA